MLIQGGCRRNIEPRFEIEPSCFWPALEWSRGVEARSGCEVATSLQSVSIRCDVAHRGRDDGTDARNRGQTTCCLARLNAFANIDIEALASGSERVNLSMRSAHGLLGGMPMVLITGQRRSMRAGISHTKS